MKFNTRRDTLNARHLLEEQSSTINGGYYVQMVDKNRYISAVSPPEEHASMAEFASPPTTFGVNSKLRNRDSPHSTPSQTLWFGGVPNELLADREGIIAKFSKYGKITDVRTRAFRYRPDELIFLTPNTGAGRPRGYMHLDFLLQEDAEKCFQELTKRPLSLFGRSLRVDYAPPLLRPQRPSRPRTDDSRSPNTVLLSRLPDRLHMDAWALLDAVSLFGEIVDLRISEPLNSLHYHFQWLT
jgi:RNA recognition motif-containing protein